MNTDNILLEVKTLLNITTNEKDPLLKILINSSITYISNYTNLGTLYLREHESLIRDIAIIRFNKLGSEGLSSESYSGASQSFINGLPNDIVKQLNSIRVVKF